MKSIYSFAAGSLLSASVALGNADIYFYSDLSYPHVIGNIHRQGQLVIHYDIQRFYNILDQTLQNQNHPRGPGKCIRETHNSECTPPIFMNPFDFSRSALTYIRFQSTEPFTAYQGLPSSIPVEVPEHAEFVEIYFQLRAYQVTSAHSHGDTNLSAFYQPVTFSTYDSNYSHNFVFAIH